MQHGKVAAVWTTNQKRPVVLWYNDTKPLAAEQQISQLQHVQCSWLHQQAPPCVIRQLEYMCHRQQSPGLAALAWAHHKSRVLLPCCVCAQDDDDEYYGEEDESDDDD